jgi:hypothetical protein
MEEDTMNNNNACDCGCKEIIPKDLIDILNDWLDSLPREESIALDMGIGILKALISPTHDIAILYEILEGVARYIFGDLPPLYKEKMADDFANSLNECGWNVENINGAIINLDPNINDSEKKLIDEINDFLDPAPSIHEGCGCAKDGKPPLLNPV